MNALLRLNKDFPFISGLPLKQLVYLVLMSDLSVVEFEDGEKLGEFRLGISGLNDSFGDWGESEVKSALDDLESEGLVEFDTNYPDSIYVAEYRGRRMFPFVVATPLFNVALNNLKDSVKIYGKSKSQKDKSRSKFIRERIEEFEESGVDKMTPSDFTNLHGYLYELYTGGELYIVRNKVEYYQTTNMLKAYDKPTVFALLVEGTLNYDKYRKKGVPTLTNVACMKDDIFRSLRKSGSKDYMRETEKSISDEEDF